MIRYLNNQRLHPIWLYAILVLILSVVVLDVNGYPSTVYSWLRWLVGASLITVLMVVSVAKFKLHRYLYLHTTRLQLYIVTPSVREVEAKLKDLVKVGVLEALEQATGGTLYALAGYKPGREKPPLSQPERVAFVHEGNIRWLEGAAEIYERFHWRDSGFFPFQPFKPRLQRKSSALGFADVTEETEAVLGMLERLGVVNQCRVEEDGSGWYGLNRSSDVAPFGCVKGSRMWWKILTDQGVMYKRKGNALTFAPRAAVTLIEAEARYNTHIDKFFRYHAFATDTSDLTSVSVPIREADGR